MSEFIIGCDEVGYGPLAGPLVVCGVKAPEGWGLEGLNDSKKLSEKKRMAMGDVLSVLIINKIISFHMAIRSNIDIDKYGVALMLKDSYVEVFHKLGEHQPILIIVDGNLKFDTPGLDAYTVKTMVKADTQIPTVMAASIIAKNYRDNYMRTMHLLHPMYGWDSNAGYLTKNHYNAIIKYGLSPLHRRSYKIKSTNKFA